MAEIFLKVVNMSISSTWMVLIVLIARAFLKTAPKWISVLLWALVALRLICPFSFESMFSLIPSSETVRPEIMLDRAPSIQTGVEILDNAVNPIISQTFAPDPGASANPLQIVIPVVANLWLLGILALLAYTVFSYFRLKLRLREATLYAENIYMSENIPAPFVLGIGKPVIYLPYNMTVSDVQLVIAHERAHIQRKDHWWKPLGFLILSVHWFNPVMWLAYVLFCRDIEMSCDEKVVKTFSPEQRANYSAALLTCGTGRRRIAPCPLAFGETGIKERIKAVLYYKKPARWILIVAVVLCAVVAVCSLSNPIKDTNLGIQDLVVKDASDGCVTLELPYNYLWGKWAVSMVPEDADEYTSNGSVPYDGSLGKYRMLISFGDCDLTDRFSEKFTPGRTIMLENVPAGFGGTLRAKIWMPQDHGFVIYIGSDVPFTIKEQSGSGEHVYGRITIPITSADTSTNEVQAAICQSYWDTYVREDKYISVTDLHIDCVYQSEGIYAIFVHDPRLMYTEAVREEKVGGVTLRFNDGQPLYIYTQGKIYGLKAAYENEIIGTKYLRSLKTALKSFKRTYS